MYRTPVPVPYSSTVVAVYRYDIRTYVLTALQAHRSRSSAGSGAFEMWRQSCRVSVYLVPVVTCYRHTLSFVLTLHNCRAV